MGSYTARDLGYDAGSVQTDNAAVDYRPPWYALKREEDKGFVDRAMPVGGMFELQRRAGELWPYFKDVAKQGAAYVLTPEEGRENLYQSTDAITPTEGSLLNPLNWLKSFDEYDRRKYNASHGGENFVPANVKEAYSTGYLPDTGNKYLDYTLAGLAGLGASAADEAVDLSADAVLYAPLNGAISEVTKMPSVQKVLNYKLGNLPRDAKGMMRLGNARGWFGKGGYRRPRGVVSLGENANVFEKAGIDAAEAGAAKSANNAYQMGPAASWEPKAPKSEPQNVVGRMITFPQTEPIAAKTKPLNIDRAVGTVNRALNDAPVGVDVGDLAKAKYSLNNGSYELAQKLDKVDDSLAITREQANAKIKRSKTLRSKLKGYDGIKRSPVYADIRATQGTGENVYPQLREVINQRISAETSSVMERFKDNVKNSVSGYLDDLDMGKIAAKIKSGEAVTDAELAKVYGGEGVEKPVLDAIRNKIGDGVYTKEIGTALRKEFEGSDAYEKVYKITKDLNEIYAKANNRTVKQLQNIKENYNAILRGTKGVKEWEAKAAGKSGMASIAALTEQEIPKENLPLFKQTVEDLVADAEKYRSMYMRSQREKVLNYLDNAIAEVSYADKIEKQEKVVDAVAKSTKEYIYKLAEKVKAAKRPEGASYRDVARMIDKNYGDVLRQLAAEKNYLDSLKSKAVKAEATRNYLTDLRKLIEEEPAELNSKTLERVLHGGTNSSKQSSIIDAVSTKGVEEGPNLRARTQSTTSLDYMQRLRDKNYATAVQDIGKMVAEGDKEAKDFYLATITRPNPEIRARFDQIFGTPEKTNKALSAMRNTLSDKGLNVFDEGFTVRDVLEGPKREAILNVVGYPVVTYDDYIQSAKNTMAKIRSEMPRYLINAEELSAGKISPASGLKPKRYSFVREENPVLNKNRLTVEEARQSGITIGGDNKTRVASMFGDLSREPMSPKDERRVVSRFVKFNEATAPKEKYSPVQKSIMRSFAKSKNIKRKGDIRHAPISASDKEKATEELLFGLISDAKNAEKTGTRSRLGRYFYRELPGPTQKEIARQKMIEAMKHHARVRDELQDLEYAKLKWPEDAKTVESAAKKTSGATSKAKSTKVKNVKTKKGLTKAQLKAEDEALMNFLADYEKSK